MDGKLYCEGCVFASELQWKSQTCLWVGITGQMINYSRERVNSWFKNWALKIPLTMKRGQLYFCSTQLKALKKVKGRINTNNLLVKSCAVLWEITDFSSTETSSQITTRSWLQCSSKMKSFASCGLSCNEICSTKCALNTMRQTSESCEPTPRLQRRLLSNST